MHTEYELLQMSRPTDMCDNNPREHFTINGNVKQAVVKVMDIVFEEIYYFIPPSILSHYLEW